MESDYKRILTKIEEWLMHYDSHYTNELNKKHGESFASYLEGNASFCHGTLELLKDLKNINGI